MTGRIVYGGATMTFRAGFDDLRRIAVTRGNARRCERRRFWRIHAEFIESVRQLTAIGDRADLRYRVLVLSADSYNERSNASPFCAPIVRQRGATELPPYAVALTEQDPITGVVVLNRMRRLPPSAGAERIGMVTGASMVRLVEAIRGLFEI